MVTWCRRCRKQTEHERYECFEVCAVCFCERIIERPPPLRDPRKR